MAKVDVKVPDIGDFQDVPVIEVLVKPGDVVKVDQSLITLESDKATMDVPSPVAGEVAEVMAKVGDKVSMGTLIARVESAQGETAQASGAAAKAATPAAAPSAKGMAAKEAAPPAKASPAKAPAPSSAKAAPIDIKIPDIGDFTDVPDHRDSGEGRRHGRGGAADRNARIRQGDDGCAVAGGWQDHGNSRQGRRQGVDGLADCEARRRRSRLRRSAADQEDEADAKEEEDAAEAPETSPVAPSDLPPRPAARKPGASRFLPACSLAPPFGGWRASSGLISIRSRGRARKAASPART